MSTDKNTGPDQSDSSVTARENLSLDLIDAHSHLAPSFEVVLALSFAARAGHTGGTCHQFITALILTGNLTSPGMWGHVLQTVMDLKTQDHQGRNTE